MKAVLPVTAEEKGGGCDLCSSAEEPVLYRTSEPMAGQLIDMAGNGIK